MLSAIKFEEKEKCHFMGCFYVSFIHQNYEQKGRVKQRDHQVRFLHARFSLDVFFLPTKTFHGTMTQGDLMG